MSGSIKLSKKYGVNPSVTHCECCGKDIGITMFGRLKGDIEAPRDVYMGLCDDCRKVIDQGGMMIIEVRDGETGNNPYRTGRLIGLSRQGKEHLFKDVQGSMAYMEESLFSKLFHEYLEGKEAV